MIKKPINIILIVLAIVIPGGIILALFLPKIKKDSTKKDGPMEDELKEDEPKCFQRVDLAQLDDPTKQSRRDSGAGSEVYCE